MGFFESVSSCLAEKGVAEKHNDIETIATADLWRQIIDGSLKDMYLLTVESGFQYIWGLQIIIAGSERNRTKVQRQFPKTLLFTPEDFGQIIRDWPDSEMLVYALRKFNGELVHK